MAIIAVASSAVAAASADNLSPDNIYVESVTIDGKPWHKSWFSHADIARGATIRFRMSPCPAGNGKGRPRRRRRVLESSLLIYGI